MNPDFLLAGACEQARLIARGQLSSDALMAAQYAAIAERNPSIRALIAQAPLQPLSGHSALAGTSFGAKDNIDVAGLPTAGGLRALQRLATADAPMVARLRAAGLHCVGKLNMHPLALGATNHNPDYGDCFHPQHPGHTAGGSSGGSAAAVAAGLCSIALGSDTMGSVRIPAAYCGVVGFKPSHETLGLAGVMPLCRMLDHVGVLARRVEDVVAALQIMAPHLPAPSPRSRPWKVGIVRDAAEHGASASVMRAYEDGVRQLSPSQEVQWVDVKLAGVALDAVRRSGLLLCEAELHALVAPLLAHEPTVLPADLLAMMRFIEGKSALDLGRAVSRVAQAAEAMEALTCGLDALILPTAPQTSFAMDGAVPANQADLTALANANGAPAISLPLTVAAGDLPVGLQLIGHRGHDLALLDIAAWVEQALQVRAH